MKEKVKRQLVLVVDDQQKVLRFIEIDLKLRGFEVITTTSGQEALDLVISLEPDIMLLDIIMPDMDGFEVLRQLRTFTQMPVITFSASTVNHNEAMRLGASDFIPKPFSINELVNKINACLSC